MEAVREPGNDRRVICHLPPAEAYFLRVDSSHLLWPSARRLPVRFVCTARTLAAPCGRGVLFRFFQNFGAQHYALRTKHCALRTVKSARLPALPPASHRQRALTGALAGAGAAGAGGRGSTFYHNPVTPKPIHRESEHATCVQILTPY